MAKKKKFNDIFEMVFGFSYPVVYHYKNKYFRKTYSPKKPNQNITLHK